MSQEPRDRTEAVGFNEHLRWNVRTDGAPGDDREPEPGFNGFGWR